MYHIAVCDDTVDDINNMKKLIMTSDEYNRDMEINVYSSGVDMLEDNQSEPYDLIVLDMQMKGLSGYETAEAVRKYNEEAVIVFMSAVCIPQPEHFEVNPYRYLMKNGDKDKSVSIVADMLAEMKRRSKKKRLEVSADGKAFYIEAKEILYLEKFKRGSNIILSPESVLHCKYDKIITREKLEILEEQLKEEGFARPHNSYLVNLRRIKAVDNMEVLMENGERISITRSRKEIFHHEFSRYFSGKYKRGGKA